MEKINKLSDYHGVQGVYCLVNKKYPTKKSNLGKPYVGQACARPLAKKHKLGVGTRIRDHIYKLKKNIHCNQHLLNAWNKDGSESFEYYLIEKVDEEIFLNDKEQFWIDNLNAYSSGYNQRALAESNRGLLLKSVLTGQIIHDWIVKFQKDNGHFPMGNSGKVIYAPKHEPITWHGVDVALSMGWRGLPGDSTLSQFISKNFNIITIRSSKQYTVDKVKEWAERFYFDNGFYPTKKSGDITYAIEEGYYKTTWENVWCASKHGHRGFNASNASFYDLIGLVSVKDAVKILNINSLKIAKLCRNGKIKYYKTQGNHKRFKIKELKQFKEIYE